jgi:hypothetical protein
MRRKAQVGGGGKAAALNGLNEPTSGTVFRNSLTQVRFSAAGIGISAERSRRSS